MLKEDEQERRNFDAVTTELHGGRPLAAVQVVLFMWARQAPPNGSYGAMLAIFANEVEKGIAEIAELKDAYALLFKENAKLRKALDVAARQNEHDMMMIGDELRACRAALGPNVAIKRLP